MLLLLMYMLVLLCIMLNCRGYVCGAVDVDDVVVVVVVDAGVDNVDVGCMCGGRVFCRCCRWSCHLVALALLLVVVFMLLSALLT